MADDEKLAKVAGVVFDINCPLCKICVKSVKSYNFAIKFCIKA